MINRFIAPRREGASRAALDSCSVAPQSSIIDHNLWLFQVGHRSLLMRNSSKEPSPPSPSRKKAFSLLVFAHRACSHHLHACDAPSANHSKEVNSLSNRDRAARTITNQQDAQFQFLGSHRGKPSSIQSIAKERAKEGQTWLHAEMAARLRSGAASLSASPRRTARVTE
jgi:hypothetical protein